MSFVARNRAASTEEKCFGTSVSHRAECRSLDQLRPDAIEIALGPQDRSFADGDHAVLLAFAFADEERAALRVHVGAVEADELHARRDPTGDLTAPPHALHSLPDDAVKLGTPRALDGFGVRLATLRRTRGLSQEELAAQAST